MMSERIKGFVDGIKKAVARHSVSPQLLEGSVRRDKRRGKFMAPRFDVSNGEYPVVDFETLYNIYGSDPATGAAIDYIWIQAVGSYFNIVIDPTKENKRIAIDVGNGVTKNFNAKEAIEYFNELVGFRRMILAMARDYWAVGNVMLSIPDGDIFKMRHIPLIAVDKIYRGPNLDFTEGDNLGYKMTSTYGGQTVPPGDMIHWLWNIVNGQAFGFGILQRFATTMPIGSGESRDEYYKIIGSIEQSMKEQFEKFSAPIEFWNFPDLDDARLKTFKALIDKLPKQGKRLTANVRDASVKPVIADRARAFDSYIDFFHNQFNLGMQTPLPSLLAGNFTEASAREAGNISKSMINALQASLEQEVKSTIWRRVLSAWGFDPVEDMPDLVWANARMLEPEMAMRMLPFMVQMADTGLLKGPEFRRIMREVFSLPLDKDDNIKIVRPAPPGGDSARTGEPDLVEEQSGPQVNP